MPNVKSIINKQNTSRLNNQDYEVDAKQNKCRSAINCPLNGKCCRNSIVYKASLKSNKTDKLYYGNCKITFKLRYNNHTNPLIIIIEKLTPELLEIITIRAIATNNMKNRTPRNFISVCSKTCNLCLSEKLQMFQADLKKLQTLGVDLKMSTSK